MNWIMYDGSCIIKPSCILTSFNEKLTSALTICLLFCTVWNKQCYWKIMFGCQFFIKINLKLKAHFQVPQTWKVSKFEIVSLSLHPLCGGGDCFRRVRPPPSPPPLVSVLKNPYSDYFHIFAVCILALGNLRGNFAFFSFFNKIQDGSQNPMVCAIAWTALSICFMFGLKRRPYPGCEPGNIAIHPCSDYF